MVNNVINSATALLIINMFAHTLCANLCEVQKGDSRKPLHDHMMASYHDAHGDTKKAMAYYEELFKKNPSAHAYSSYFSFLLNRMGDCQTIISMYEQRADIQEALKKSLEGMLTVAQSYLNTDQDTKAETLFESLATDYPDNEQVAYFSCLSKLKRNDLDAAMVSIDTALSNFALRSRHFLFYLLKSKILVQQNKLQEALTVIEKSIEQFPRFDRAHLFKAVLLEQMGSINEAIQGYKKFLDIVGHDEAVEKQLVQLLFSQNHYGEALKYLKRANNSKTTPECCCDIGVIEFKGGNYHKALEHFNEALKLNAAFTKARILKIETLLQLKKTGDALQTTYEWLTKEPTNKTALHTFMLLRKAGVQPHALIKKLTALQATTKSLTLSACLADLYMETHKTKLAEDCYNSMLKQTNDPTTLSKILFHLGYVYFITKRNEMTEKTLKKALKHTPSYPSAYNLLAYYYAENNQIKNLPEALALIDQALAMVPNCYYYLDTKGYIMYKLGNNEQALELFKQAERINPQDPVIKNHISLVQGATK